MCLIMLRVRLSLRDLNLMKLFPILNLCCQSKFDQHFVSRVKACDILTSRKKWSMYTPNFNYLKLIVQFVNLYNIICLISHLKMEYS